MADDPNDSTDARLSVVLRSIDEADTNRTAPPSELWQRIAADPRVTSADEAKPLVSDKGRARTVHKGRRRAVIAVSAALAVAASIIAVLLIAGGATQTDTVLASAPLSNTGLASFPVTPSGHADLITRDGQTYLQLTLVDAPSAPGSFLEVWLIDRDIHGMVSLGPYAGNGRYLVPLAVPPGQFPVVDVSVQPANGVPTHSGVSVVRGTLPPSTT